MPLPKNLNYKMKYRPNYAHVGRYKELPPPMAGDPVEAHRATTWAARCEAIYWHMIAGKSGLVPPSMRRGLWLHNVP